MKVNPEDLTRLSGAWVFHAQYWFANHDGVYGDRSFHLPALPAVLDEFIRRGAACNLTIAHYPSWLDDDNSLGVTMSLTPDTKFTVYLRVALDCWQIDFDMEGRHFEDVTIEDANRLMQTIEDGRDWSRTYTPGGYGE